LIGRRNLVKVDFRQKTSSGGTACRSTGKVIFGFAKLGRELRPGQRITQVRNFVWFYGLPQKTVTCLFFSEAQG